MGGLLISAIFVLVFVFVLPTAAIIRTRRLERRLVDLEHKHEVLKRQLDAQSRADFGLDQEFDAPSSAPLGASEDDTVDSADAPEEQKTPSDDETASADAGFGDGGFTGPPPPRPPRSFSPEFEFPKNLEELLGAKWAVWVGGIAMSLGGIFLVRYAAEQGLLGPEVRIFLGVLLSLALGGAGEWLRRREQSFSLGGYKSAYLPGVLTGAAIIAGFATVYAAYALYNFLDPLVAFMLLAAVSFVALFASWHHGPGIAALGLIGSYATPALVSTQSPSAWSLFTYLLIVTAATYPLARVKHWLWLAKWAAALAFSWGFLWQGLYWNEGDLMPIWIYVVGLLLLGYYFLSDQDVPPRYDWTVSGILALTSFLAFPPLRLEHYSGGSLSLLAAAIALLIGFAWLRPHLSRLVPWAGILFGLAYVTWHIPTLTDFPIGENDTELGLAPIAQPGLWQFLVSGFWFASAIGAASFVGAQRHVSYRDWLITAATVPVLVLGYAYWRATDFGHSIPFGFAALALSAIYVFAADYLFKKSDDAELVLSHWGAWGSGVMAASAVSALALALTMTLEKGWLTITLALICPGLALIAERRPVPNLRYLAALLAGIVAVRLMLNPVVHYHVGDTPIFNWLLIGYGIPMLAFAFAAERFRRLRDDRTVMLLEGVAVLFLVVLTSLQIRHLLNGGDIFSSEFSLAEAGLQSSAWLALSMMLRRLRRGARRLVITMASTGLAVLGLGSMLVLLLFAANPLFTGEMLSGNSLFNTLIVGYLIPAALCGAYYYTTKKPDDTDALGIWLTRGAATACLVFIFVFASLELRAIYHWPILSLGITSDAEQYAYSALWLVLGILLLGLGTRFNTKALRLASLVVIGLTVSKVFLFDMSNLTGIFRALSFIGLGAALLGIGYFYQRFVFPGKGEESDAATDQ